MDWMCERAGLMEQSSQSVQPNSVSLEPAENAPVADLRIRIGELELAEALAEREVGGAEAGRHMRAQIHFELLSDESQLEPAGASYTFELLACEQASQQSLILASARGELQAGKRQYTELVMFDFPPVGDYQLLATVRLPEQQVASTAIGPLLHIVP